MCHDITERLSRANASCLIDLASRCAFSFLEILRKAACLRASEDMFTSSAVMCVFDISLMRRMMLGCRKIHIVGLAEFLSRLLDVAEASAEVPSFLAFTPSDSACPST